MIGQCYDTKSKKCKCQWHVIMLILILGGITYTAHDMLGNPDIYTGIDGDASPLTAALSSPGLLTSIGSAIVYAFGSWFRPFSSDGDEDSDDDDGFKYEYEIYEIGHHHYWVEMPLSLDKSGYAGSL